MQLRSYQNHCVDATLNGFAEFRKQLIVCPTGGGKTVIFAELARRIQPKRTLVLAHREELINQAVEKIFKTTGLVAEVEMADMRASPFAPVIVASIQTMMNRLPKYAPDHFGLLIPDEAHHCISQSWQRVLNYFDPHADVVGVTATPDRGDKRNLGQYFENIAFEITLLELIKQGYLSPIKVKALPLQIDLSGVRQVAGDFSESDLGNVLAPYLRSIAKSIKEHAGNRKVLVFVPLIATSLEFVRICREEGLLAEHVDGNSPDRKAILKRFSRGETRLLSNAMLLTEGYDEPTIDCVVILRPTKSRPLYSQMVGRGTRLSENKSDLLLLDFLWMHEKHNLIRPAHLVATSDEIARAMTELMEKQAKGGCEVQEELDLLGLESTAKEEREQKLREELDAKAKRRAKTIDAMEFCLSLGDLDLAEYEPTMGWHEKPISDGQKQILERSGIDLSTVRGRGHASAMIDKIFARQRMKMATPKQVFWLRRMGHYAPESASFEEASEFLSQRWNKEAA